MKLTSVIGVFVLLPVGGRSNIQNSIVGDLECPPTVDNTVRAF